MWVERSNVTLPLGGKPRRLTVGSLFVGAGAFLVVSYMFSGLAWLAAPPTNPSGTSGEAGQHAQLAAERAAHKRRALTPSTAQHAQLAAERAELTAKIAAYDGEIRLMKAAAADAREQSREGYRRGSMTDGGANAGYAQGMYQNIQKVIQQRSEAQRRLIEIDQELERRQ
jgi:hypothetical protein